VGVKKASNEVEPVVGGSIVKVWVVREVRAILVVFDQRMPWWEGSLSSYQSIYDASGGPNIDSKRAVWAQVIESFGSHIFAGASSNGEGHGVCQPLAQAEISQFNPPGR
jgi:hypothetical protein